MGCGHSSQTSPANNHNNRSSKTGHPECSSKISDDSVADDDKRKNYGGVYVGVPTDPVNIPSVQIGSLRVLGVRRAWEKYHPYGCNQCLCQKSKRDSASLRKPLWGNGL